MPTPRRFTYLLQSVDTPQTFDLELAKSKSMDNPVFYVQMAHARACNIERFAADRGAQAGEFADVDLSLLIHDRELEVLRSLHEYPERGGCGLSGSGAPPHHGVATRTRRCVPRLLS